MNGKSFNQILAQVQTFYKSITAKQLVLLMGGGAMIAGVLWLFVNVTNSVDYKTLYSNLDSAESQQIAAQLTAKNISFQLSPDNSTLKVPADQVDKLRLDLATQGLPQNGRLGFEIFDKPNWSGSDFAEKVNYQRAMEGELERTIQTINGVDAVRVHLVLPRESLFADQERKAKAAVVLRFRGRKLGDDSGRAIKFLVASAVDSLNPEDVTIVNAEGRSLLADEDTGIRHDEEMEKLLADKLVATLSPVTGMDRVKANVTVAYDLSTSEENKETYDPTSAVAISKEMSEEHNGGAGAGGVPGTASNIPGKQVKVEVSLASETSSSKSESGSYAVNKTVRHTVQPAGKVQRITAAVLVDEDPQHKYTPDEMKNIEDLAKAAIGFDAARGDVLKVQNMPFQLEQPEKPVAPALPVRVQEAVNNWSTALRYAAVILAFVMVYLLVLRPVKNQLVTAFKSLPLPSPTKLVAQGAGTGMLLDVQDEPTPASLLKKQLTDKVKREPENASKLIQAWMREEEKKRR